MRKPCAKRGQMRCAAARTPDAGSQCMVPDAAAAAAARVVAPVCLQQGVSCNTPVNAALAIAAVLLQGHGMQTDAPEAVRTCIVRMYCACTSTSTSAKRASHATLCNACRCCLLLPAVLLNPSFASSLQQCILLGCALLRCCCCCSQA
jgi:hypothetical protein